MLLSTILADLADTALAEEALLALGDLVLLARLDELAAKRGIPRSEAIASSVALFCDRASEDDWVSLMGAMGHTSDPGLACLSRILAFSLSAQEAPRAPGAL